MRRERATRAGSSEVSLGGTPIALLGAIFLLGAWLRLDQFLLQVLTDDEWHAVHQVSWNSPQNFLLSFGVADYSIPLTLLYWFEAKTIGLSEVGMRWPMMAASLSVLVLFPLWVQRRFGWSIAVTFALLLAISPLLINYSRNARPYGLTLLLGFAAHFFYWRYWTGKTRQALNAFLYGACAGLSAWLHLLTLPFVVAPLVLTAGSVAHDGYDRSVVKRWLLVGIPVLLFIAALVVPPIVADLPALANKSGSDSPNLDTWAGLGHLWLGTASSAAVVVCLALGLLGAKTIWQDGQLIRSVILGLGLSLVLIYLAKPAWIHNPLTFGRYLLPGIVILLLAVAAGVSRVRDWLASYISDRLASVALLFPPLLLLAATPIAETMAYPNSYSLHSTFQFDYRKVRGDIRETMARNIPLSPWWATLAKESPGSLTIAAAPYEYFSPRWDAPRWEATSRQRVIPGYLTGLCVTRRDGEPPDDERFAFRNAVHLNNGGLLKTRRIDFVVFQKPYIRVGDKTAVGLETRHCLDQLAARLGGPVFEDDMISVFRPQFAGAASIDDQ